MYGRCCASAFLKASIASARTAASYWRITDPPLRGAISPDWFLVLGVPPGLEGRPRRSYVLWQEHQRPLLVVEFASGEGTEERDRSPESGKFWVYERRVCPAYYFIWEPEQAVLEGYHLVEDRFEPLAANTRGRYAVPQLGAELGV